MLTDNGNCNSILAVKNIANILTIEITIEVNVFVKNNEDVLWMLLITLLPSATTEVKTLKLESNKTNWEIFFAASEPLAIAIEQSALFKARMSLTPSPVIATHLPASFKAITSASFWSGETLPKIVNFLANFLTCSIVLPSRFTYKLWFLIPAFLAISATVTGSSPEITLISTLLSANHFKIWGASSLMWSSNKMTPTQVISNGNLSFSIFDFDVQTIRHLYPFWEYSLTIFSVASLLEILINPKAPIATVPILSKVTALHFNSLEKGKTTFGEYEISSPKCFRKASAVKFSSLVEPTSDEIIDPILLSS